MPRGDTPSINPLENPFREPKKRKGHEYTGELIEENLGLEARRAYEAAGNRSGATSPEPKQAQDLMTAEERAELARRQQEREHTTNLQEAKRILKKDYLGPEAVARTWGVTIEQRDIPPIPFSRQELERAKERNQFLIYRIDQGPDGKPLSLKSMNKLFEARLAAKGKDGWLLNTADSWKNRMGNTSYSNDTPRAGWALVQKELMPGSTSKDYLQQTELLIDTLQDQTFKDRPLPKEYAEAIAEFESKKTAIANILRSDWQTASKQLSELKITQLTRQTLQETIYDLALYYDTNDTRLLPNTNTWTSSRSPDGHLVNAGYFKSTGVDGGRWSPPNQSGSLGLVLARRS